MEYLEELKVRLEAAEKDYRDLEQQQKGFSDEFKSSMKYIEFLTMKGDLLEVMNTLSLLIYKMEILTVSASKFYTQTIVKSKKI